MARARLKEKLARKNVKIVEKQAQQNTTKPEPAAGQSKYNEPTAPTTAGNSASSGLNKTVAIPDFKNIGAVIEKSVAEKKALYLGTGHQEIHFNRYLAQFLQVHPKKNDIVIFGEGDAEAISNYCQAFDVLKMRTKLDFDTILKFLKEMNKDHPTSSNEFIALLLTLHLSDIKIIAFDDVPANEAERQKMNHAKQIMYGAIPNISIDDLHKATAYRASKDIETANTIKSKMPKDKICFIIGGPAHVKISETLQIDALNVMPDQLYRNILLGSHEVTIQNLQLKHVTSYAFNSERIKLVDWKDSQQQKEALSKSVGSSLKLQFGSPITKIGDAHNCLINEISKIVASKDNDYKEYLEWVNTKQYGKMLRTACNSCRPIDADKDLFNLIQIVLSYKEKVPSIALAINEKNSQGKAAIDYAALKGNEQVYKLLIHNGAHEGNARAVLQQAMSNAKPTQTGNKV